MSDRGQNQIKKTKLHSLWKLKVIETSPTERWGLLSRMKPEQTKFDSFIKYELDAHLCFSELTLCYRNPSGALKIHLLASFYMETMEAWFKCEGGAHFCLLFSSVSLKKWLQSFEGSVERLWTINILPVADSFVNLSLTKYGLIWTELIHLYNNLSGAKTKAGCSS